jgi:hypothetical protein
LARHGTYGRASPPGARIARWYCPEGHCTFSLLPDCLAARLSGTLAEVEQAVESVEQAVSREAAADALRTEIELPGALRWIDRRRQQVHHGLHRVKGLFPETFAASLPTLHDFRQALGIGSGLLVQLREIAAPFLPVLPPPLGFLPPPRRAGEPLLPIQHSTGADPPPTST